MKVKDNGCFYCEYQEKCGLMICCERCEAWFHYKCVYNRWDLHLRKSQLSYLSDYYCYPCRRANPSLKLKLYSSENYNYICRLKNLNEDDSTSCGVASSTMANSKATSPTNMNRSKNSRENKKKRSRSFSSPNYDSANWNCTTSPGSDSSSSSNTSVASDSFYTKIMYCGHPDNVGSNNDLSNSSSSRLT